MKMNNRIAKLERRQAAYDALKGSRTVGHPNGKQVVRHGACNAFYHRPGSQKK